MNDQINVALVGLGRIGKIHLDTLTSDSRVNRILSCDPDASIQIANQYGQCTSYHDHKALLQAEAEIDAVLICSPTRYHYQMIADFAERGTAIFCEKPLSLDLAEILSIRDMLDNTNVKLQVGFNRRFDQGFRRLQERIQNGDAGDLEQLSIISRDPAPPPLAFVKDSGGLFMDMSIHDFDMARFLVGQEVVEVFATGDVLVDDGIKAYDDIDTATIILKFQNGLICTIQNSRRAVYGYDQRVEAFGSAGVLKLNNRLEDQIELWNQQGYRKANPLYFFLERYAAAYRAEVNEFIDRLIDGEPFSVGYADTLQATKIAIAAKESLRLNKVVTIDHH